MDQHQRRLYDLAAELGDLEVQKRQHAAQIAHIEKLIEVKHSDIRSAIHLRDLAKGPVE